jgi:putative adhesin
MVRFATLLAVVALTLPSATLKAQDSDEEWLDDCRHDSWRHDSWRDNRVKHCEIRETGLRGPVRGGALTVDPGMNGGVEVEGWDRDSVAVTARIQVYARSEADAEAIAREIRIEAAGRTVRAVGPEPTGRRQSWSVSFVVMVPRRTDLSLATDNGPLSVRDVTGRMELSTQNGPLSLVGVAGDVHARAQNGPLSVKLTGTRWDGTGLDAETKNGPAVLRIPEDYNAKLDFGTVNGPMDVGFPLTVTINGRITDRISTTLGNGGAPIRVVTTNGPMSVRRM